MPPPEPDTSAPHRRPRFPETWRTLARTAPGYAVFVLLDALLMVSELTLAVVLPWWIASRGGAVAVATCGVAIAAATLVAMPLAAPFSDRLCKARQIRWGTALQVGTAAALVGMAAVGRFHVGLVIGIGLVQVAARVFVSPAREVILTEMLPTSLLPQGLRVRKAAHAASAIGGPLVAGVALGTGDVLGALLVHGALLCAAFGLSLRLAARPPRAVRYRGVRDWWGEVMAGMTAKWRVPIERGWTSVNFVLWIFQGPAVGMLIPLKVQSLGLPGDWLGIGMSGLAGGVLVGSLVGTQGLVERFGRYRVRLSMGVLEGLALAGVGLAGSGVMLVTGLAVAGFCNASLVLIGSSHRALAVPPAFRSRLFAAQSTTTQLAGALGPALVGVALARWHVDVVYAAFGLLMAVVVVGFTRVPRFKEFLSLEHEQVVDWYAREYPGVFGPAARRADNAASPAW